MTLQIVDEFDTRAMRYECSVVRVVFDPVGLNYYVGHDWGHPPDNMFKDWTQVDWGRPLSAKRAHRRVRSFNTNLCRLKGKMACAHAIEVHAKARSLW